MLFVFLLSCSHHVAKSAGFCTTQSRRQMPSPHRPQSICGQVATKNPAQGWASGWGCCRRFLGYLVGLHLRDSAGARLRRPLFYRIKVNCLTLNNILIRNGFSVSAVCLRLRPVLCAGHNRGLLACRHVATVQKVLYLHHFQRTDSRLRHRAKRWSNLSVTLRFLNNCKYWRGLVGDWTQGDLTQSDLTP